MANPRAGQRPARSKPTRAALAEQAAQAALLEHASDATFSEGEGGQLRAWNAAAAQLFGISAREALGHTLQELGLAEALAAQIAAVRASQQARSFPWQARARSGASLELLVSAWPVQGSQSVVCACRALPGAWAVEATLQRPSAASLRVAEVTSAHRDLRTLLDGIPSMIGYWDCELRNRFANRAYHDWFGFDSERIPGMHMSEVLGEEVFAKNRPYAEAALRGETQRFERELTRPGESTPRNVLAYYFPDVVAGRVHGFYVLVHDISELTESRRKLAAAERDKDALLSTLHGFAKVSVTDRQGRILQVNDAFCEQSGYTREELIGQDHRILSSHTHSPEFWRELWRTIGAGKAWRGEICNRDKSGELHFIDTVIAPLLDVAGEIERYVSIRIDVTESRNALKRLADSEAFLERAGRIAGVGGWKIDIASQRIFWTQHTRRIHEVDDDFEPTLAQGVAFYAPEARPQIQAAVERAMTDGTRWDLELPFITATGRRIWVRAVGEAEFEGGKATRLYGTFQDVTAARAAQQALRDASERALAASAAKSEFLANMSHEIRTPLNAVLGLAYLLEQSELNREQRGYVAQIRASGRALLGVINDVLDLSKIEAGQLVLEDEPFELRSVIDEVLHVMASNAEAKGVRLSHRGTECAEGWFIGDPTRMRQVLLNLVSNAVKFTREGEVAVSVECVAHSGDRRLVTLHVRDTGIGIAADALERLFDAFAQADGSTTRRFGGTGLGLSIVRRLVTLMGGEVGVESTFGEGSHFWFAVPLQLADLEYEPNGEHLLRVLVVSDVASDRNALQSAARLLGWHVDLVDSGERLLERMRGQKGRSGERDAVIVALTHESLVSAEALEQLRAERGAATLPALVLLSDGGERNRAIAAAWSRVGAIILRKPFTVSDLFNAVNEATITQHGMLSAVSEGSRLDGSEVRWLCDVRVLVVDDSEVNRELTATILGHQGAAVTLCSSGEDALARLTEAPTAFDVVLMDVQMPGIDGNETTRRIRDQLGLSELTIIAMTAGALLSERQRALAAGMDDFLSKPIDPPLLTRVVRRYAERARGRSLRAQERSSLRPENDVSMVWPAIEGIDEASVRSRFAGDRALFLHLLKRMLSEFADLPLEWPDAEGRRALQARMHKLAGGATTLGALALHELAAAVEDALEAGAPATDAARAQLRQVGAAIAELAQRAEPVLVEQEAQELPGPKELDLGQLRQLLALLSAHDLAAMGAFQAQAAALQYALGNARFSDLQRAVHQLEFERARELLDHEVWARAES